MKLLLFSGTHSRHLYIHKSLIDCGYNCSIVLMQREELIPEPPVDLDANLSDLYRRHFRERSIVEEACYGNLDPDEIYQNLPIHKCTSKTLNDRDTCKFVLNQNCDLAFIFGCDLIKNELFDILPEIKINLHLGLSPWYRGSATLFWPFYMLQAQYCGSTFHQIVPEADAGGIVHQSIPNLKYGDGIHDVGVRTVQQSKNDLIKLMEIFQNNKKLKFHSQKNSGRLYLTKDFQAEHLKIIYQLFDNNIIDYYLNGNLNQTKPRLINAF